MPTKTQWELTSAKRASRSASPPNPPAVRDRKAGLRPTFAPTDASKRLVLSTSDALFHERLQAPQATQRWRTDTEPGATPIGASTLRADTLCY